MKTETTLRCCVCQIELPWPKYNLSFHNVMTRTCTSCRAAMARENGRTRSTIIANVDVTPVAFQVILGSLIGDGGFERPVHQNGNWGLSIKHSLKQESYLFWKAKLLGNLVGKIDYPPDRVRVRSIRHPLFTDLASRFVPEQKKIVPMLDVMKMESLAFGIWYLDDGCLTKPSSNRYEEIRLCTQGFALESTQLLMRLIELKTNARPTKAVWKNPRNPEVPYIGIRLYRDQARKFFRYICSAISNAPEAMQYKIRPMRSLMNI